MAHTLADVVAQTPDSLAAGIIQKVILTQPFFNRLPITNSNAGLTHKRLRNTSRPSTSTRQYGAAYSGNQKAVFVPQEIQLKPHGFKMTMDFAFVNNPSAIGASYLRTQAEAGAMSLSEDLWDFMINGDGSAEMTGIKTWLSKAEFSGQITDYAEGSGNTNGVAIATPAYIVSNMNTVINLCGKPDFMVAPIEILSKIDAISTSGNNSVIASRFKWMDVPTGMGLATIRMATWDGIPFLSPGQNSQGTNILRMNETKGNSNITGSIYAVKYGPNFMQLINRAPGPEITSYDSADGHVEQFDWYLEQDAGDVKSLAQLRGILV